MARATRGLARPSLHRPPGPGPAETALRAKKGPARGSIENRLPPLASREDEMEIPLVRAPLPAPSKKFLSPAVPLEGPMAVVALPISENLRRAGLKILALRGGLVGAMDGAARGSHRSPQGIGIR